MGDIIQETATYLEFLTRKLRQKLTSNSGLELGLEQDSSQDFEPGLQLRPF